MHGLGLTNRKGGIIKRRHRFQLNHLNSKHAIFLQMSLISGLPYLKMQKALIFDSTKKTFLSAEGSTGWKIKFSHNSHPYISSLSAPVRLCFGSFLMTSTTTWGAEPQQNWTEMATSWHLPTPILVDVSVRRRKKRKKQLRTCKLLTPVWSFV